MKKKIIMPMVIALCLVSSFLAGRVEVNGDFLGENGIFLMEMATWSLVGDK